ncbi:MAG: hypothetical protein KDA91_08225 [Planctomycetaceae bacterium]|nr:hypothetical protein [Planctomycetaceae bacterium]
MNRPVVVACLKWGHPYPPEYVNVLAAAVKDNLSFNHRFVCITDAPEGLSSDVEVMPLPEIPIERAKWNTGFWPKLAIFKQGMFDPETIVLYLDVDLMVTQSLDPFIEILNTDGGLRIIREWNPDIWNLLPIWARPDRGGNGSAIGFIAKEQYNLFDTFEQNPYEVDSDYRIDQVYITETANRRRYWPHTWCLSFRRSCVPHWPLNLLSRTIRKPRRGKLLAFHGCPNPTDVVADGHYRWGTKWRYGFGPIRWVQEYWNRYAGKTDSAAKAPAAPHAEQPQPTESKRVA